MRRHWVAIGIILLIVGNANATSLVKLPAERIRGYLAELFVAGLYCREFNLRHNMIDLVWDILELKTGIDVNSESQVELTSALVKQWEARFKADRDASCGDAYRRYGPNGPALQDAIYLK